MCAASPKAPPPPPPPPEPPKEPTTSQRNTRRELDRRRAGLSGMSGTNLTGGSLTAPTAVATKSLLGQ